MRESEYSWPRKKRGGLVLVVKIWAIRVCVWKRVAEEVTRVKKGARRGKGRVERR